MGTSLWAPIEPVNWIDRAMSDCRCSQYSLHGVFAVPVSRFHLAERFVRAAAAGTELINNLPSGATRAPGYCRTHAINDAISDAIMI